MSTDFDPFRFNQVHAPEPVDGPLQSVRLVDDDNEMCILCREKMPLDGEEHYGAETYYRANRVLCCRARYCLEHESKDDLPRECPACKSLPIASEKATKDQLVHHAEKKGKTWAMLELAERYNKRHSSIMDEQMGLAVIVFLQPRVNHESAESFHPWRSPDLTSGPKSGIMSQGYVGLNQTR